MKKRFVFLYLLGLLILFLVIWQSKIDLSIFLQIKRLEFIFLSLMILFASFVFLGLRMKFLFKSLGEQAPLKDLIKIEFINKFAYAVLPLRLNVPVKALISNRLLKVSKGHAISIAVLEFALDSSITFLLALFGSYFLFKGLQVTIFPSIFVFLLLLIVLTVLVFLIPIRLFDWLVKKMEAIRFGLVRKALLMAVLALKKIRETWGLLLFNKKLLIVLLMMAAYWFLTLQVYESVFFALNMFVPLIYIAAVVGSALFLGGISQIPSGLGVREATMVFLFSLLGYPVDSSTIVVLIVRVLTLFPIIAGYLFSVRFRYDFLRESEKFFL